MQRKLFYILLLVVLFPVELFVMPHPAVAGSFSTGVIDTTARANAATAQATANTAVSAVTGGTVNAGTYSLNGNLLASKTAPTIASGFGTSPSIPFSNGTAAFYVDVGSGGTASLGSINMNVAAPHYWSCSVTIDNDDLGTGKQTIFASVAGQFLYFEHVTISTGAITPWVSNDIFFVNCVAM